MTSVRRTISLPPAIAERLERQARRKRVSVSAVVAELVSNQPERLPYAGMIDDDQALSLRVEEVVARLVR
jgi:hypothetical protein